MSLNDEYWCWTQDISLWCQAKQSYMVATATDLLFEELVAFWSIIAFSSLFHGKLLILGKL
jgi:hypothetical protein